MELCDDDDENSGPITWSLLLLDNYHLLKPEFLSTSLFISVALAVLKDIKTCSSVTSIPISGYLINIQVHVSSQNSAHHISFVT